MLSESLFICFFFAFLIALIFAFILLFEFFIGGHLLRLTPGITKLVLPCSGVVVNLLLLWILRIRYKLNRC